MTMIWDLFCRVIDNHGDLGFSWRLASYLAGLGHKVRFWVDDPSALDWMAPNGCPGIEVKNWAHPLILESLVGLEPSDVLLESFGCEIDPAFIALYQSWVQEKGKPCAWINLEYLSAQAYVERNHGLLSPVQHGPGKGLIKYFFYPGFNEKTGGLLREPDLLERQRSFDPGPWLAQFGIVAADKRLISLFCYEPPALPQLLAQLARSNQTTQLLVCAGRPTLAVKQAELNLKANSPLFNKDCSLFISYLPYLSQIDFDHLLWACDLNLVRGEDSLVRALWAGKPWVWQIYPQHDGAHHDKLAQVLKVTKACASLRHFHQVWNDLTEDPLSELMLSEWQVSADEMRQQLLKEVDLGRQLLTFVNSIRTAPGSGPN